MHAGKRRRCATNDSSDGNGIHVCKENQQPNPTTQTRGLGGTSVYSIYFSFVYRNVHVFVVLLTGNRTLTRIFTGEVFLGKVKIGSLMDSQCSLASTTRNELLPLDSLLL